MKKQPTVAIYSGVSANTTFIERLIEGVANAGTSIYIFGANTGKPIRHKQVYYKVYGKKWHKLLVWLKYAFLLWLFKSKEKRALDNIIATNHKNKRLLQLKYYPVLYYRPKVFHIQWAKSLEDWVWVKDFGMKLVVSLRGAHINYSPIVDSKLAVSYKQNFPKVDKFHAVSNAIAMEANKYGANKHQIQVVKSGLNLKDLVFRLKEFNLKSPLHIVSVGRDHWIKNYRLALDTMFELKQLGISFHYRIIGVSDNEGLLFQRAQLGLENEVDFIAALPFNEVQNAIQEADVFFLPSLKEGIANVVLEAMALGTLVVSTNCGGMGEVVIPDQTGFLVPIRNAQAMAEALKDVSLLNHEEYQKLTQQARAFIEAYHNDKQMITGMQSLYDNIWS